jgi:FKBP-type peptidyl-prolyl cis-trans isomerase
MGRRWISGLIVLTLALLFGQIGFPAWVTPVFASETVNAGEPTMLKTQDDKTSYAIGVETGKNLLRQQIDADPDIVARGIKDAMKGDKLLLTDEELLDTLNLFAGELRIKRNTGRMLEGLDNKKAGEEFLAENKTKDGVVTLPGGLQYKVLKEGEGKKPTNQDSVEIYYSGSLIDGTEFDSTSSGQPATLKLSDSLNVISGLREALKLMPVGSKWQIFIPHTLAYGQRGTSKIGSYSTLIFEVELSAIK